MADPALGTLGTLMVDFEQSWGTAKGSPDGRLISFVSESITPQQELLDNPSLRGDFSSGDPLQGVKAASGDIVVIPNLTMLPFIGKLIAGSLTTTGAGSPYTHTAKFGTSTMPASAILEAAINIGGTLRYKKMTGARVNSWKIPINPAGYSQQTLSIMGKDQTIETSAYDATATDWRTGTPLGDLQIASANLTIDGSPVGYISKGEVSINANLRGDDYRVGAGGTRGSLVPGRMTIDVNMTLCVDSTSVLTLVTSSTNKAFSATWTQSTFSAALLIPRFFLNATAPAIQSDGPIMVDLSGRAAYDSGELCMAKLTVVNGSAGTVYA